jgi:hypothetical protein
VARPRHRKEEQPLPPPLPPAERTVGQLVAETLRLYGRRFFPSLALGIGPAVLAVTAAALEGRALVLFVVLTGPPLLSASYVGAAFVAGEEERPRGSRAVAFAIGLAAFLPLTVARVWVFPGIYIVVLAYFALVALGVPAALYERLGVVAAFRRGVRLARADYVHALGSVATLVITIILTMFALFFLLARFGEATLPVAAFLAFLVLAPVFFLGCTLLYDDNAARAVDSASRKRRRRRGDADVHPALDPDGTGRPDAQVEPRAAARGES